MGVKYNMPDTIFTYSDGTTSQSSDTTISSNSRNTAKTLTSVNFGDTVTSIASAAFTNCTALTTISIPNNIISLGSGVFSGCTNLTSAFIGSGVNTINTPYTLFNSCTNLTNLSVDPASSTFASQNNVLCNKALNTIIMFPQGITGTFSIPSNITTISNFAFYSARITQVVIPNSVTSIVSDAFNSSLLTSITIPSSVTNFGDWICLQCPELVTATVNASKIGYSIFRLCPKLTSVTINGSPPRFEGFAFGGCSQLKSINIPSSVTEIREYVFDGCSNLLKINFPGDMPTISPTAFQFTNPNLRLYRKKHFVTGWTNTVNGVPVEIISNNIISGGSSGRITIKSKIN